MRFGVAKSFESESKCEFRVQIQSPIPGQVYGHGPSPAESPHSHVFESLAAIVKHLRMLRCSVYSGPKQIGSALATRTRI